MVKFSDESKSESTNLCDPILNIEFPHTSALHCTESPCSHLQPFFFEKVH